MADHTHVQALVEQTGLSADEARAQIDQVFAAIPAVLKVGKTVGIPGVARIIAKSKPEYVPGSLKRQARMARKPALMNVEYIEQGPAYDSGNRVLGSGLDFAYTAQEARRDSAA